MHDEALILKYLTYLKYYKKATRYIYFCPKIEGKIASVPLRQAEAELGQAQHSWKLGFAEVDAELDNNGCRYEVYSTNRLTLLYFV